MSELEKEIERLISEKKRTQEIAKIKEQSSTETVTSVETLFKSKSKDYYISQLRKAKIDHKRWMGHVQVLIRLGNIHEAKTAIPMNYAMCDFGKWYYGDGQVFLLIDEFIDLELAHRMAYDTYLQIYNLYKVRVEGSLFKGVKKQERERLEKVKSISSTLEKYSKTLIDCIAIIENKIKKMNEEQFNILIN